MLTEKQEAILDYVRQVQAERGFPPSTREIQRQFGYASQNTAMSHLRALARKEQIDQLADGRWGNKAAQVQGQLFEMPVYGEIPAGLPAMQEQEPLESIPVDPRFFGVTHARPHQLWALRVRGDSMIDAGILDGDIVIMARVAGWTYERLIGRIVSEALGRQQRVASRKPSLAGAPR